MSDALALNAVFNQGLYLLLALKEGEPPPPGADFLTDNLGNILTDNSAIPGELIDNGT